MTVRVETARHDDADAIATILSDWIDETSWMPRIHSREEDRGFGRMLIEKTDVIVALKAGEVVGFLSRRGTEVEAFYLTSAERGQGTGSLLLNRAKKSGPRLELWTFQANRRARRFYLREGFQEVKRTDGSGNDEKLPDIRLVWHEDQARGQMS